MATVEAGAPGPEGEIRALIGRAKSLNADRKNALETELKRAVDRGRQMNGIS